MGLLCQQPQVRDDYVSLTDEISKLVERSAQLGKEFTALIEVSGDRGHVGTRAVATVHGILSEIETNATAYAAIARQSSMSLGEQAQVSAQAVRSMDATLGAVESDLAATPS